MSIAQEPKCYYYWFQIRAMPIEQMFYCGSKTCENPSEEGRNGLGCCARWRCAGGVASRARGCAFAPHSDGGRKRWVRVRVAVGEHRRASRVQYERDG